MLTNLLLVLNTDLLQYGYGGYGGGYGGYGRGYGGYGGGYGYGRRYW